MGRTSETAVEFAAGWRGFARAGRDERRIVAAAQAGSAEAAESLVRQYWDEAHRAAFLIVQDAAAAEDIAQDAMLAALRNMNRFDCRRSFRPWLHRIVANAALDHLRKRERRGEVALVERDEPASGGDRRPVLSDDVAAALASLDPESRTIVVLRHLLGFEPKEIAAVLARPSATVRTRLRRALATLQMTLDANEEECR